MLWRLAAVLALSALERANAAFKQHERQLWCLDEVKIVLMICCFRAPAPQGSRQVTRASVEFYGPDRAKWLGPFSEGNTPSYLKGEYPGESWGRARGLREGREGAPAAACARP